MPTVRTQSPTGRTLLRNDSKAMPWFNRVGAAALALALSLLAASAPAAAARTVEGGVVLDGVPPSDAAIATAVHRYAGAGEARLLDWLSDGELLIAARANEREQLQRLRATAGKAESPAGAAPASIVPLGTVVSELFPTAVRYTGSSLAFTLRGREESSNGLALPLLSSVRERSSRARRVSSTGVCVSIPCM